MECEATSMGIDMGIKNYLWQKVQLNFPMKGLAGVPMNGEATNGEIFSLLTLSHMGGILDFPPIEQISPVFETKGS